MPGSTPNSIARHRPTILILAGAAAAYATYLIYDIYRTPPAQGLHRSNAVRRPSARHRRQVAQAAHILSRLDGDSPIVLGELEVFGAQLSLEPHVVGSPTDLHHRLLDLRPDASTEDVEAAVAHVYGTFLDRLLALISPTRPLSAIETEAVARWVGDRVPDGAAVARAVERHASVFSTRGINLDDTAESVAPTELSGRSDDDTEDDGIDPDGQTLQRTLYHIAEDRARQEGVVHRGITCNGCDEKPIRGIRWHCANCADFDLCSNCEATNSHVKTHIFYKIRVPAPYLSMNKQEPLYPGKPHMMSASINSALRRRLLTETAMETEEIEALWDQFTCLAGTEWLTDTSGVGWALDRQAFNHAFIPRYSSFVPAPNLIYDRIFSYYDTDKNGLIGFEEWIKGLDGMHAMNGPVKSRIIFNGYDIDEDGYISRKDVLRILRAYYAVEKEATCNYIAEMTEDLSIHNAMDTIRSSQPLGSAFPPHGLAVRHDEDVRLQEKRSNSVAHTTPVLRDGHFDVADRGEMLVATDVRNIGEVDLARHEQDRVVMERWARRQFYVDEEEGLNRPEGAEDDVHSLNNEYIDEIEQTKALNGTIEQTVERPRWSRSSSRVRFQDDVDAESRSNASLSSRPWGERWGGYEIPEAEKDLGREILYQITQQGFNELLNPLFEDRETDAMNVSATRNERRTCKNAIKEVTRYFNTTMLASNRAIAKIGIFRYSKCIVDMFCQAINRGLAITRFDEDFVFENFKDIFRDKDGERIHQDKATYRLGIIFTSVQEALLDTINVPNEWKVDELTLWNTWLCANQVQSEIVAATLSCATQSGWVSPAISNHPPVTSNLHSSACPIERDPTMPQFRPNSAAELDIIDPAAEHEEITMTSCCSQDRGDHTAPSPGGPFFISPMPICRGTTSSMVEDVPENDETVASTWVASLPYLPRNNSRVASDQPTEPQVNQLDNSPLSGQGNSEGQNPIISWRNYTNNAVIHFFHVTCQGGLEKLESSPQVAIHSTNPYQVETDQQKPLVRHVRELAMDHQNASHIVMLASLEAVQREIIERKGSGLVNFEEFDEHMREGKLRFLETWMDWVSI